MPEDAKRLQRNKREVSRVMLSVRIQAGSNLQKQSLPEAVLPFLCFLSVIVYPLKVEADLVNRPQTMIICY